MEVNGQLHAPATLPLHGKVSGPQSRYGPCGEEKINHAWNRTPVVQLVARHYVDLAIQAVWDLIGNTIYSLG
jgi:hypothetical protein